LTRPEDLRCLHTLTGTKDEQWFYLISTAVEAKGGALILCMMRCIQAASIDDAEEVTNCLRAITAGVKDLGVLLERMHENCDPQIFYHNIRPLLAGSKGMAAAGLPRGVFYDEGDGMGEWRQYSGGSNAQSSLIQLFDIVLGVDHHQTGGVNTSGFIQV
jgi:indoleamine 2,3-dioxygenase